MFEFRLGHNCWRVETVDRMAVIIDGQAYFRALCEGYVANFGRSATEGYGRLEG